MSDPKITIRVEGSGLPAGGADGQVLSQQNGKPVWAEPPKSEDSLPLAGGTLKGDLNIGTTSEPSDAQLRIAKRGADGKGYQMASYISGGNAARMDYIASGAIANFMQMNAKETGFGKPVRVSSGGTGVTSLEELKTKLAISEVPSGATAHQQLVTDADGVAKWEDKTFGELLATELVLANTPATWKSWSYNSHYYNIPLVESETSFDTSAEYMVIVNGARYNAVPKFDTRLDINGVLPDVPTVDGAVGHGMFIYNHGNVCLKNIAEDNPVNLEITIFKRSVTVKTIAPKFLPENVGGVLVGSVSSDGLSGISFADIYSSFDERKPVILVGHRTYEGLTFYSNALSDNASSGCTFHAIKIYDGMVQIHELSVLPDGTVSKTLHKLTPTT